MNFCTKCGNRLEPNDRFCVGCGRSLDVDPDVEPATSGSELDEVTASATRTSSIVSPITVATPAVDANASTSRPRPTKLIVAILSFLLVVAVGAIVFATVNKQPRNTADTLGVRGLTSAQLISLEKFELRAAVKVQWSKVGGLQAIVLGLSKQNYHWATWEWAARNADPLTGYAHLGANGWRNINPKLNGNGGMERAAGMSNAVFQGKWADYTIGERRIVALGFSLKRYE